MNSENGLFVTKALAVMFFICLIATGPALAEFRMSVKVETANVRSGPGENHPTIWKIEKWHPVNIINQSGAWYQFEDFEGDRGWIHTSLVDRTPTVIVSGDDINIRSKPNIKSTIRFTSERGVSYKVLKREGDWVRVKHSDGDTGWIFGSLVW